MVAGVQKGGTTTLHAWLAQHPDLVMSNPKEVHFFDRDANFPEGGPDYDLYHASFPARGRGPEALRGESTPIYLWWPGVLERIRAYNPACKLIVLLRCPAERAWSHYRMSRKRREERRDFLAALQAETIRIQAGEGTQRGHSYIARGFYAPQILKARALFPEDQLLFLRSRELLETPAPALGRICDFLGVRRFAFKTGALRHVGLDLGPMPEEAKAYLRDTFEADRREVERLLGWDCSDWLR